MAAKVEAFVERVMPSNSKYPWNEWADGSIWELVKGEDYQSKTNSMRMNVYKYADKNRLTVKSQILDEGKRIRFQLTPKKRVAK